MGVDCRMWIQFNINLNYFFRPEELERLHAGVRTHPCGVRGSSGHETV